jgi:hypothetical protein
MGGGVYASGDYLCFLNPPEGVQKQLRSMCASEITVPILFTDPDGI